MIFGREKLAEVGHAPRMVRLSRILVVVWAVLLVAASAAASAEAPVIVRALTDEEALAVALIENIQRDELSPLEEAEAFARLAKDFDKTQEQVAEVTVRTKGPVLRVRERDQDMYTAIDHAAKKLERQAAKYRDRRKRHRGEKLPPPPTNEELAAVPVDDGPVIVKSKRFTMQPMSPEDASLQLDLLNHDFYVFRDDGSGEVNVIYRRRDGNYGLIAPDS